MTEMTLKNLDSVADTLLFPLYFRAMETQRPDALLKDEKAVALIQQFNVDFSRFKFDQDDQAAIILRNREMDRHARDFMARNPQAVVVHIGCGLDARFERVENGLVEWYDLDLPEVIELRRKLIGDEKPRYHFLACSMFDGAWQEQLSLQPRRSFLFLSEGVFQYFEEAQIKALVLSLRGLFPGAELVFDAILPWAMHVDNLRMRMAKSGVRFHWGLKHGKDLETWGEGIRLLDEWHYFDHFEPRLARAYWMRHIPFLANISGIFHYRLGDSTRSLT
jgi:O-methyltransferase involved in polyketide biosynthesis